MSDSDKWFLLAMKNAVDAGQLSTAGQTRVKKALGLSCPTCDDTGHADGTPEMPRCMDCYCAECTFSPCQC